MEIEDQSGLNLRLNTKNHVASVVKSPKATGAIFIPRIIQHEGSDYKIISLDNDAFNSNKIESITFPPDSEVTIFKKDAFLQASIKKLQIPSSLKIIEAGCFFLVTDLAEIEISPQNKHFSYVDNKYLVGKSNDKNSTFDTLIYGRYDIEEAEIPSYIKILKRNSFNIHLKSLKFPEDSQIESIEFGIINKSFKKLTIPSSLKKIDQICFQTAHNITEIEISPKNEFFKYIEGELLLTRSSQKVKLFDKIIFCRRDATEAKIPNYIKTIDAYSFSRCNRLKTVTFENDSKLETIENYAFSDSSLLESIVIPSTAKTIGSSAFYNMANLTTVQLQGEDLTIDDCCFSLCSKLKKVVFLNAKKIFIDGPVPEGTKVLVKKEAELTGDLIDENKNCIQYIDESLKDAEAVTQILEEEEEEKKEVVDENELKIISMPLKKFNEIVKYVRSIEDNLSKFEDFEPYDFDSVINECLKKDEVIKKEEEEEEVKEKDKENENVVAEEEEEVNENNDEKNKEENKEEAEKENNEDGK